MVKQGDSMKCIDYSGHKYGRLTVIDRNYSKKGGNARWNCVCECGNNSIVTSNMINKTKSCGCLTAETASITFKKHGLGDKPERTVWRAIKSRCYNKKNVGYEGYGGRGISMCDEWLNSFDSFEAWLHSNGWSKGLQIDRIDNNGNYCPENCRIVTNLENCSLGRRRSRIDNATGYTGVFLSGKGFVAEIRSQGKRMRSKTVYTIKEAVEKRIELEDKMFGYSVTIYKGE